MQRVQQDRQYVAIASGANILSFARTEGLSERASLFRKTEVMSLNWPARSNGLESPERPPDDERHKTHDRGKDPNIAGSWKRQDLRRGLQGWGHAGRILHRPRHRVRSARSRPLGATTCRIPDVRKIGDRLTWRTRWRKRSSPTIPIGTAAPAGKDRSSANRLA